MIKIHNIFIGLLFLSVAINGCRKDKHQKIPFVPVDVYVNTTLPAYTDLNPISGWIYITGGSKGIIVYHGVNRFYAYERHSPYAPENNCIVAVPLGEQYAEDPCSGSQFLLTNGSVIKGPAVEPLLQYQTYFDGNTIHIYN